MKKEKIMWRRILYGDFKCANLSRKKCIANPRVAFKCCYYCGWLEDCLDRFEKQKGMGRCRIHRNYILCPYIVWAWFMQE